MEQLHYFYRRLLKKINAVLIKNTARMYLSF